MWNTQSYLMESESIELSIKSTGHNLGKFSMLADDEPVEIDAHIRWTGGQEARTDGPPENCQPGYNPDAELRTVTLNEPLTLTNADGVQIIFPVGYSYYPIMSNGTRDRIEQDAEVPRYEVAA
jgi:hypothetical protein